MPHNKSVQPLIFLMQIRPRLQGFIVRDHCDMLNEFHSSMSDNLRIGKLLNEYPNEALVVADPDFHHGTDQSNNTNPTMGMRSKDCIVPF
jgi:hypothetical protein